MLVSHLLLELFSRFETNLTLSSGLFMNLHGLNPIVFQERSDVLSFSGGLLLKDLSDVFVHLQVISFTLIFGHIGNVLIELFKVNTFTTIIAKLRIF